MLKECQKVAIICQDLGSADDLLHVHTLKNLFPRQYSAFACSDIFFLGFALVFLTCHILVCMYLLVHIHM